MENNSLEKELENWKQLDYRLNNEGMDYALRHYSDWKEIKDKEFRKLKKKYLQVTDRLIELVAEKINELDDKLLNE